MPWWGQVLIAVGGAIWAFITTIMGWALKEAWNTVKEVRNDLNKHKQDVALNYVPKSDYKEDVRRIYDLLQSINEKLDNKADKSRS